MKLYPEATALKVYIGPRRFFLRLQVILYGLSFLGVENREYQINTISVIVLLLLGIVSRVPK